VLDQVGVQLRDLLLGDLDLLQRGGDLLESQIALLASPRDQPLKLIGLDECLFIGSVLQLIWHGPLLLYLSASR
jgi:hypothetical protein